MALNALTAFGRGQSARILAGPAGRETTTARIFRRQRRRPVVDARPRLAGTPRGREAIGGRQSECESPGNGAVSLGKGSIRARKWRPAWAPIASGDGPDAHWPTAAEPHLHLGS